VSNLMGEDDEDDAYGDEGAGGRAKEEEYDFM
jgi:hypothetical protein